MALLFATGAQWLMLQSVAWTGMLFTYSRQAPLLEAVQMTFDGNHPCSLCEHIRTAEKDTPQKDQFGSQTSAGIVILGTLVENPTVCAPSPSARLRIERHDTASSSRSEQPLSPPPRRVG